MNVLLIIILIGLLFYCWTQFSRVSELEEGHETLHDAVNNLQRDLYELDPVRFRAYEASAQRATAREQEEGA